MSKFVLQSGPATEVLQSQEYVSNITLESLLATIQALTERVTAAETALTTQGNSIGTLNTEVASITSADQTFASEIAALTQGQTDQGTAITNLTTKVAAHKDAFNILGTYAIQGSLNTADVVKNVLKLEHNITQQVEATLTGQLQHNVLAAAVTAFTPSADVFDSTLQDMTTVLGSL